MLKSMEAFPRMGIPDLAGEAVISFANTVTKMKGVTYAEKSADPVAARVASDERRACQTAPLWPIKVPILLR